MDSNDKIVQGPLLQWTQTSEGQAIVRSRNFDDIYFSGNGISEARHVFFAGNRLASRIPLMRALCIGELGFGTGLNFLVAWNEWRELEKPIGATFDFLSFEKFPLEFHDMERAHAAWPSLQVLSDKLRKSLPERLSGFHRISIEPGVSLTLVYGDATDWMDRAEAQIDAWFLDGFAPSKNSSMWDEKVFAHIARLSRPGATFSTFSVAGMVRRNAEAAGFQLERAPGFGNKREMLTGVFTSKAEQVDVGGQPWFAPAPKIAVDQSLCIAIIGAGIAGASLAHALKRAGIQPTIFDKSSVASGASGNPAGLVMPRLDVGDTPAARFHLSAYLSVLDILNQLEKSVREKIFRQCGVVMHARGKDDWDRFQKLFDVQKLPADHLEQHEAGLLLPKAGVVSPRLFVESLLAGCPVKICEIRSLEQSKGQWRLTSTDGLDERFDIVILANSINTQLFHQLQHLPLQGSAGQLEWFAQAHQPERAHTMGNYLGPGVDGGLVAGASYEPVPGNIVPVPSAEISASTLSAIKSLYPGKHEFPDARQSHPRVSMRCTTKDRLPLVGMAPDSNYYLREYQGLRNGIRQPYPAAEYLPNLYVLTGLGSRGLVTAPLSADIIVAQITGGPMPVDREVRHALHPGRFLIRDLKRNRTPAKDGALPPGTPLR